MVKIISTVDILKYSTFKSIFCYAREIDQYMKHHGLKNRKYDDKDTTHISPSHLNDTHYASAIKQHGTTILPSDVIDLIYQVLAIAGNIDQIAPDVSPTTPTTQTKICQSDQINTIVDHYNNENSPALHDYCQKNDISGKFPFIRSFYNEGGCTPFDHGRRCGDQHDS